MTSLLSIQVTEAGIIKSGNQTSVPANVISVEEVRCNITSTGSLPLHAILVSVSNNNGPRTSQSEPLLFIAHDPICWSCTVNSTGQTASCTREVINPFPNIDTFCSSRILKKKCDKKRNCSKLAISPFATMFSIIYVIVPLFIDIFLVFA